MTTLRRVAGVMTCLAFVVFAERAAARPFSVSDLLRTEGIGRVIIDPTGRWLAFERRESYTRMLRFDMLSQANILRSRSFVVDLASPALARPLVPSDSAPGTILYGFSPDGTRIALGRFRRDRWQLGVVTLATEAVRWFDLSPGYNPYAKTLEWLSEDRLVTIAEPGNILPWWLRTDSAPAEIASRWAMTAAGGPVAATVVGSGRFSNATPTPPPRELALVNVVTGNQTRLATGRLTAILLSPDRRRLAMIEEADAIPPDPGQPIRPATEIWRRRLSILDLRTLDLWNPCPSCDVADVPVWSPRGAELAFFARRDGETWDRGRVLPARAVRSVVRIGFSPGFTYLLSGPPDAFTKAAIGWRGSDLVAYGRPPAPVGGHTGWYRAKGKRMVGVIPTIERQSPALTRARSCEAAMTAADEAWCLDRSRPQRILDAATHIAVDRSVTPPRVIGWRRDRATMTVIWTGDAGSASFRLDAAERLDPATAAAPAGVAITRRLRPGGGEELVVLDRNGRHVVSRINEHLVTVDRPRTIAVHHRLADGTPGISWLYLPANPAKVLARLPMVVIPYPGDVYGDTLPADQDVNAGRYYASAQLLAGHGYAVLLPAMPPRAASRHQPFRFDADVMPAIDAAIDTGQIDPARLALWGHSYGAYAAAIIATQTDRFRAIVATAGIYDLAGIPGTFVPFARTHPQYGLSIGATSAWAETGQGAMGTMPWDDPERYVANSPLYRAGRIVTPVLIVTADRDISPQNQAEQLFSALYRQGKDAELVTYWGEGHVIGSPANIEDLYRRVFAWLDTLTAAPSAPGPAAAGKP